MGQYPTRDWRIQVNREDSRVNRRDRREIAGHILWPHNARSMRFRGLPIAGPFLRHFRDRRLVCPDCLSESLHHRAVWDLSFFSACPSHRREMVSSCPACDRPLAWNCGELNGCACGRSDLRLVRPNGESPAPEILHAIAAASGLLGDERYQEEATALHRMMPMCELDARDAFEFVCRVGLDITFGGYNAFRLVGFGRNGNDHAGAIARGIQALGTWPDGFLDERQRPTEWTPLMLWQTAIDGWLALLPPSRGKSIKAFVEGHPVVDLSAREGS